MKYEKKKKDKFFGGICSVANKNDDKANNMDGRGRS